MSVAGSPTWIPTVSTLDVPRITGWRPGGRQVSVQTGSLRNHAYGDPAVDGQLEIAEVAWLQVARITAERHRVVHEPADALRQVFRTYHADR